MLDWLRAGDSSRALNRVNPDTRSRYANLFGALSQAGTLASAVDAFGSLGEANVSDGIIEILLVRDGTAGQSGFWIYVIWGTDGSWRIDSM
ncbi:MAG TPA: hypothetical protein VFJ62_03195 [Usitatibacter sp.]|nr:hypothetical protein [Usitatibacter sp.]